MHISLGPLEILIVASVMLVAGFVFLIHKYGKGVRSEEERE